MAVGHGNPPYREAPGGWSWHGGPPTRNGPRGASKSLDLVYGQPLLQRETCRRTQRTGRRRRSDQKGARTRGGVSASGTQDPGCSSNTPLGREARGAALSSGSEDSRLQAEASVDHVPASWPLWILQRSLPSSTGPRVSSRPERKRGVSTWCSRPRYALECSGTTALRCAVSLWMESEII